MSCLSRRQARREQSPSQLCLVPMGPLLLTLLLQALLLQALLLQALLLQACCFRLLRGASSRLPSGASASPDSIASSIMSRSISASPSANAVGSGSPLGSVVYHAVSGTVISAKFDGRSPLRSVSVKKISVSPIATEKRAGALPTTSPRYRPEDQAGGIRPV